MIEKVAKKSRMQKGYTDLLGIDFSTTATKVVRLKKVKGELSLVGIDLMPAVDFGESVTRLDLPRSMSTFYGCLAYTGNSAVVRMVNTEISSDEEGVPEVKLRGLLNVSEDFRVSSRLIMRGKGRQGSSLLAVAIPDDDANFLLNMFPSGPPAPASLEISGLAFISAFLNARAAECEQSSVCLLEVGESISHFAFLNKGEIALVGKMAFGAKSLRKKVAADLGVDDELAVSILNDRSINISSSLSGIMGPFIKQLSISKDFVERHQGCRILKVYVSGGLSLLPSWVDEVGKMLHAEIVQWSPLENIQCAPGVLSDEMKQQATRFSAAIGAALGGFEE